MGLDMYMSARLHLSEYCREDCKPAFDKLARLKLPGMEIPKPYIDNYRSVQLEVPIAYWRKANHIHSWFVDNVQGGEDNCGDYHVSLESLAELDTAARDVFMSRSEEKARELLPPANGFFFGGKDIDDWYWEQTRETMDLTAKLLVDFGEGGKFADWELYYSSSW